MPGQDVHVVPAGDRWKVERAGQELSNHDNQEQAIAAARREAEHVRGELIIHGRDGRLRDRDSHGHDPHPPKGAARALAAATEVRLPTGRSAAQKQILYNPTHVDEDDERPPKEGPEDDCRH